MHLVVEFKGIVSVGEVLLGLCLYLRVGCNPVEKMGGVVRVFGVSHLVRLESFVMALFFFKCSFVAPSERPCQIIASDKSCGVQHSPANHNRDARHGAMLQSLFFKTLISDAV